DVAGDSGRFELRLADDPPPEVRMPLPTDEAQPHGPNQPAVFPVVASGEVPLHVLAEDRVLGLRSVWVSYRTAVGAEAYGPPRAILLHRPAPGAAPPTQLEFKRTIPVSRFRHARIDGRWWLPDGPSLQAGDRVLLEALADDFDDVTPGKEPGASKE